jgi:hypothetical protein
MEGVTTPAPPLIRAVGLLTPAPGRPALLTR